ncbi:MAG: hypothetical protein KGK33_05785 [Hyphomicrobiales bacterium]|nr:hypothetical protein [Hyphomicrobiales bacterium]
MTAIQTISFVGGVIGIATGIFVLFDRILRNRPLAYVVLKGNQHNPLHYIRVKNIGAIDLIVLDIKASPRSFEVSKDHSVKGIAGAILDKPSFAVLMPGAEQDFPFFRSPKRVEQQEYAGKMRFSVYWRKCSSTWLCQIELCGNLGDDV